MAAAALVVGCGGEPDATGRAEEAVTVPPLPTALRLDGPDVALTGACERWTVTTVHSGASGALVNTQVVLDTTVTISASGAATLYGNDTCGAPLGGAVIVPANQWVALFYVKATTPTSGDLTASAANLDDASASYEVADLGAPAQVGITLAAVAPAGACVPMTVRLLDANGFRVVTAFGQDVELWAGAGHFYADAACTNGIGFAPTRTIAPNRGSVRVWTVALDGHDYRAARLPSQQQWTSSWLSGRFASALTLTGPAGIGPGECKAITVKTVDAAGLAAPVLADLPIALGGAGAGAFYSDRLCSAAITATTITAGKSARAVYFGDPTIEEVTLTAEGQGLGTSTLALAIASPTRIALTGDPLIAAGTTAKYTVALQALIATKYRAAASDVPVTIVLARSAGDGGFCADLACATSIAKLTIQTGVASATFYFRQPTVVGAQVVTLSATDVNAALAADSFNVTVIAPTTPAGLRVTAPAGASADAGTCARVDATVLDPAGAVVATPTAMEVKLTGGATVVFTSDTCVTPIASRTVTIAPGASSATFYVKDPAIEAVTLTATGRFTVAGVSLTAKGTLPFSMRGELAITGGPFAPLADAHEGLCQSAALVVRDGNGAPTTLHPAFTATLWLTEAVAFTGDSCSGTGASTLTVAVPAASGGVTFSFRTPLVRSGDWALSLRATSSSALLLPGGSAIQVHALASFALTPVGPLFVDDGEMVVFGALATWSDGLQRDLTDDPATGWSSAGPALALSAVGTGTFLATAPGSAGIASAFYEPVDGSPVDSQSWVLVGPPHEATVDVSATLAVGATTPASYHGTWSIVLGFINGVIVDDVRAGWTSDRPDIATVDAITGIVTAIAPGVATITGTFKGLAASSSVTVSGPPAIAMSPPALTIPLGGTAAFTAATEAGVDVSAAVAWSTSDASVATVAGGTVTGVAVGTAVITASYGDVVASRPITVVPPVVRSLAIAPIDTLIVGAASPLAVTATYSDGSTRDVSADVDWTSSSPTVAWASTSSRLVVARSRGAATLTAAFAGVTASRAVDVYTLTVPGGGVPLGGTRQMTATVVSPAGAAIIVTNQVTWSVEYTNITNPGVVVATIDATGLLRGVSTGLVAVRARLPAGSGYTGSWLAPVAVNAAPTLQSMRIVADDGSDLAVPTSMTRGEVRRLRAFGTFVVGGVQTVAEMTEPLASTWTSPLPATVASFGSGWFAALAAPSDPAGVEVSATGVLIGFPNVRATARLATLAPPVTGVDVTPSYLKLPEDARSAYRAVARYADGSTADVPATAAWSSSEPTVAEVDATGDAGAIGPGTATLSASAGGLTGSARVDVVAGPVAPVVFVGESVSLLGRSSRQLYSLGVLADGSLLDLTGAADWTSADPTLATVGTAPGERGLVRGTLVAADSVVRIVATLRGVGLVASTELTVRPAALTAISLSYQYADGLTINVTALGSWSDGGASTDITQTATWTSSDPAIATVISPGVIRLAPSGHATITVTQAGVSASIEVAAAA